MKTKLKQTIQKHNMLNAGESVCAALSGGADSVALLILLHELAEELGVSLSAVHINHLLRGSESDRDESFCRDLCDRLDVPLTVFREDALAFSHSLGVSVETGARELRYKLFDELPCSKIATAHNLNDNAETLIFRLARGTGLRGMSGIPPVRGKFIRPLIECSREEIEAYLCEICQDFVTDSSNLTDDYARNRIRHKIMPEMSAVHDGFLRNIPDMVKNFSEDEDFLTLTAQKCENESLFLLHPAIRKRVIINQLKTHNLKVCTKKIDEIEEALMLRKSRAAIENGYFAAFDNGVIRIYREQEIPVPKEKILHDFGEKIAFGDKFVTISKESGEKQANHVNINKKSTICYVNYDKIQGDIVLRNRLRADRIKPCGSACTKELRKILQDRLPPEERRISAVLADDNGVFWSEHAGIDVRVMPDGNTENYLRIEIR